MHSWRDLNDMSHAVVSWVLSTSHSLKRRYTTTQVLMQETASVKLMIGWAFQTWFRKHLLLNCSLDTYKQVNYCLCTILPKYIHTHPGSMCGLAKANTSLESLVILFVASWFHRSRAEDRVGHLSVVGRYHRLPARLEDDYNVEKKAFVRSVIHREMLDMLLPIEEFNLALPGSILATCQMTASFGIARLISSENTSQPRPHVSTIPKRASSKRYNPLPGKWYFFVSEIAFTCFYNILPDLRNRQRL